MGMCDPSIALTVKGIEKVITNSLVTTFDSFVVGKYIWPLNDVKYSVHFYY